MPSVSLGCHRLLLWSNCVPVTAKLSKRFYDVLGEDVANEMVDWLNAVDLAYRANLRELNDLNFARFDAKLEQRVTALDSKLEQRLAALESKLEQKLVVLESKLEQRLTESMSQLRNELSDKIGDTKSSLLRWM